jgi:CBS-domain-containing membrane protein
MAASQRKTGAAIAIVTAIGAVVAMTIFHLEIPIGCAIAVTGIVIGTGVARGKFSSAPDATKRN